MLSKNIKLIIESKQFSKIYHAKKNFFLLLTLACYIYFYRYLILNEIIDV